MWIRGCSEKGNKASRQANLNLDESHWSRKSRRPKSSLLAVPLIDFSTAFLSLQFATQITFQLPRIHSFRPGNGAENPEKPRGLGVGNPWAASPGLEGCGRGRRQERGGAPGRGVVFGERRDLESRRAAQEEGAGGGRWGRRQVRRGGVDEAGPRRPGICGGPVSVGR